MEVLKNKGGRPRTFERDDAVTTAMGLFRRHGFEGVSITMLTKAMNIAPPSLYAAFGSKADLFREVLDKYALDNSVYLVASQSDPDATLAMAVERMFERSIKSVTSGPGQPGCIISTGLLGCHPENAELADELKRRRSALRVRLCEELGRWLPAESASSTANFLCAVLEGIAVQARDGADPTDLHRIAQMACASIPEGGVRMQR